MGGRPGRTWEGRSPVGRGVGKGRVKEEVDESGEGEDTGRGG